MEKEQIREIAAKALDHNPDLESVFVSSDGVPFISLNLAANYAASLTDKTVTEVSRDDQQQDEQTVTDVDTSGQAPGGADPEDPEFRGVNPDNNKKDQDGE